MSSKDLPKNSFASRVQILIQRAGNKERLAKLSGISATMVGKYAEGAEPARDKLVAMAAATGVNLLWLATGEAPMLKGEKTKLDGVHEPEAQVFISHRANDPDIIEIMNILEQDLPEAKKFILMVLRGRKETKEGLEGLGLTIREENIR